MELTKRLPQNHRKLLSIYITCAFFLIVNIILDPSILRSWDRVCTLALQFAPLMVCAMSQTCVMLTGGIDLSLGTTISMMTAILATTMTDSPGGILLSILITIAAGAAVGAIMGSVVTYGRLPAIIVTLAFSYVWKGVALYLLPSPGGFIPSSFSKFMNGSFGIPGGAVVVVICLMLWKIFKNSRMGLAVYATGDNPRAAYANGINVERSRVSAYIAAGIFAAIAGMVVVGQTGSGDPNIGTPYQMNSIAASVLGGVSFLGGIGQMKGTIIGAFVITSLINILFFSKISPFYQYIVQGLILIVAIGLKVISYYRNGGEEA